MRGMIPQNDSVDSSERGLEELMDSSETPPEIIPLIPFLRGFFRNYMNQRKYSLN